MNANELAGKLNARALGEYTDWLLCDAVDMLLELDKEVKRLKAIYEPSTKEFLGVSPEGNLLFKESE